MEIVALAAGGLVGYGIFLLISWSRSALASANLAVGMRVRLPSGAKAVAAVTGAVLAGAATGWPAAALGGGLFGYCLPVIVPLLRSEQAVITREEAIATWVEMLRDTVAVGQGLRDVLNVTSANVPDAIGQPVQQFNRELRESEARQSSGDAFSELAESLDSPVGSLVAIALSQVDQGGVGNVTDLLNDLARTARGSVSMRRRVETARQKSRTTTRGLLVVFVVLVIGFRFLTPAYLRPYQTPAGQFVLLCVMGIFGMALYWLVRLNRLEVPEPLRLIVHSQGRP